MHCISLLKQLFIVVVIALHQIAPSVSMHRFGKRAVNEPAENPQETREQSGSTRGDYNNNTERLLTAEELEQFCNNFLVEDDPNPLSYQTHEGGGDISGDHQHGPITAQSSSNTPGINHHQPQQQEQQNFTLNPTNLADIGQSQEGGSNSSVQVHQKEPQLIGGGHQHNWPSQNSAQFQNNNPFSQTSSSNLMTDIQNRDLHSFLRQQTQFNVMEKAQQQFLDSMHSHGRLHNYSQRQPANTSDKLSQKDNTNENTYGKYITASKLGLKHFYCALCKKNYAFGNNNINQHVSTGKHMAALETAEDSWKKREIMDRIVTGKAYSDQEEVEERQQQMEEGAVNPKKRTSNSEGKRVPQKYSEKYDHDFGGIIRKSIRGDGFAHCKRCKTEISMSSGRTAINRHLNSKMHKFTTAGEEESSTAAEAVGSNHRKGNVLLQENQSNTDDGHSTANKDIDAFRMQGMGDTSVSGLENWDWINDVERFDI